MRNLGEFLKDIIGKRSFDRACTDGIDANLIRSQINREALGDLPEAIADENGVVNYSMAAQNEFQKFVRLR